MKRQHFFSRQKRLRAFRQPYIQEIEQYLVLPRKVVKTTFFQAITITLVWIFLFSILAVLQFDIVLFSAKSPGLVFMLSLYTILGPGLWIKCLYQSIAYFRLKRRLNIWDLHPEEILF